MINKHAMKITAAFMTTGEAGRRLNVSAERVRQLHSAGILPAERTAKGIRLFSTKLVEQFARHRERK